MTFNCRGLARSPNASPALLAWAYLTRHRYLYLPTVIVVWPRRGAPPADHASGAKKRRYTVVSPSNSSIVLPLFVVVESVLSSDSLPFSIRKTDPSVFTYRTLRPTYLALSQPSYESPYLSSMYYLQFHARTYGDVVRLVFVLVPGSRYFSLPRACRKYSFFSTTS